MLHFSKKDIWVAVGLTTGFWATRLFNLRLWPIFTDEAIYTRWSQIALHDASLRFLPLTDGKQPLWHWFTMVAMKVISDPLIAGRFVSAAAGFGALIGIFFLAWELFHKKHAALIASILYLFTPFNFFYDRIALVDSMLAMWGIWALYFGVKTAKSLRLDHAMLTGFAIGAGLLTKSPAVFWQYLFPLNLLFLHQKRHVGRWLALSVPTMVIAEAMRNIMRLSPWMHMIGRKNLEFVVSFSDFFKEPWRWFWGNLPSLTKWWVGWLTWPLMVVSILGFVMMLLPGKHPLRLRGKFREVVFLLVHAAVPLLAAAAFGKVIFARYMLFATPPLLLAAAVATDRILTLSNKIEAKVVFVSFLAVAAVFLDFKILTDPLRAPIIQADRDQYVDGFPAGWGIDEVIGFLKREASDKKIFLGTQGTFGLMPASFELYLWDNNNIEIRGYWPVSKVPKDVVDKAGEKPTYFVYYESYEGQIPPQDNIELVKAYQKGIGNRFMYLYRVFPEDRN